MLTIRIERVVRRPTALYRKYCRARLAFAEIGHSLTTRRNRTDCWWNHRLQTDLNYWKVLGSFDHARRKRCQATPMLRRQLADDVSDCFNDGLSSSASLRNLL